MRLVDLHGILLRDTPSAADRDAMLAVVRMSLPIPVSPQVESISLAQRKRLLHKRSTRCLRTNRDFAVRRFGDWKWNIRRAALTPDVEEILRIPDAFIERALALKRGRSSTVAVAQGLVLKRYNFKKPLNLLKDLFRGSRGRRGFRKAHHLELCGLASPPVVATADHRVLGFPVRSYVLMAEVPDAIDAGQWNGDPREASRRLGRLLAQLHNEGFTHRDLKETNILFDKEGRPHLIDLDGLEFVFDVSTEDAAANLKRLAAGLSAAGKLNFATLRSFLLSYCRQRRLRPRALFPRSQRHS
jgi:tRNA A-37 threonylcarbamoyl transferase component Bud32